MPALNFGQPQAGIFQVIELDAPTEATFTRFYATALTWDGANPIRPFA